MGPETASLNNILRQCKERLLGHYRRWLTILAIWLGQCYVSGLDSLSCSPPISPFLPSYILSFTPPSRAGAPFFFIQVASLAKNNSSRNDVIVYRSKYSKIRFFNWEGRLIRKLRFTVQKTFKDRAFDRLAKVSHACVSIFFAGKKKQRASKIVEPR